MNIKIGDFISFKHPFKSIYPDYYNVVDIQEEEQIIFIKDPYCESEEPLVIAFDTKYIINEYIS